MATIPIQPMEVAYTVSGGPAFVVDLPEAASQTFIKGAVLALDNAGYVAEAAAALTGAGSIAACRIVGVALEDGHNGATAGASRAKIAVADGNTVFRINCDTTTAVIDVGRAFLIEKSTHWIVDKSAAAAGDTAANRVVQIINLDPNDAVGDTNGRYLVMFSAQARALTYTS